MTVYGQTELYRNLNPKMLIQYSNTRPYRSKGYKENYKSIFAVFLECTLIMTFGPIYPNIIVRIVDENNFFKNAQKLHINLSD